MLAVIVVFAGALGVTDAHGAGVWRDPTHYVSDESFAGLRFISEFPAQKLTIVGTDDGASWWMLEGSCSGDLMTEINFDFLPKGGSGMLTGRWQYNEEGVATIIWPDGNQWIAHTYTPAFDATLTPSYHGMFLDPAHLKSGTFSGVRVIAEYPQHTLNMVGSDDGVNWWFLKGICHDVNDLDANGKPKPMFKFDFSPKGGPPDLTATWDHFSVITFPDGNQWYKPQGPGTIWPGAKLEAEGRPRSSSAAVVALPLVTISIFALGWMVRYGKRATAQLPIEQL